MPRWILLFLFMTISPYYCSRVRAEQFEDPNLKFSILIPDGFVRDAQPVVEQPDFVHVFRRTVPPDVVGVTIVIERMRGTIGRDRLDMKKALPGFAGQVLTVQWRDFELDALEILEDVNGTLIVNYNVQVPLKREAIQLRVVGSRERKDQLLQLTNELLASLKGDSNWLPTVAPAAPVAGGHAPDNTTTVVTMGVIGFVAGLILFWLVSRMSRRGMVLGLALLLYAASWTLAPKETREMRLTIGVLRLLGFLGIVLGVIDLCRRPTAKVSSTLKENTKKPNVG